MAHHKLILEDDFEEEFKLIGIHASVENYKIAFLLNQHLHTNFKRRKKDLDLSTNNLSINFPIFEFYNAATYYDMFLIANKSKSMEILASKSEGLFSETSSEKTNTSYLIPEYKKVDFFIKVYSDLEEIPLLEIISEIKKIKQVISAYEIEIDKLKSINNLIFE